MDRTSASDARARSSLSKAQEYLKTSHIKEAIETLSSHLTHNQLTPVGFQCLELLADLCLTEETLEAQKLTDVLRRCRNRLRGTQQLDDNVQRMVDIVMTRVRAMCVKTRERVEALEKNPSEGDLLLASMTGVSLSSLAEKRYVYPCHNALRRLIIYLCRSNSIGFAKKLTFIYNKTLRQFLAICKEFGAQNCIADISSNVANAVTRLVLDPISSHSSINENAAATVSELRKERAAFLNSAPAITETVESLCCILNEISNTRQYGKAFDVVLCLKKVCDVLEKNEEVTDVLSGAYETMSDIFWTCGVYNYHAHCLSIAASLKRPEKRGPLASRAVLAALCVADENAELDPFGRHRPKSIKVNDLFESPITTKSILLDHLRVKGVYALAAPDILKLAASLEDSHCTDFNGLHKSVTALTSGNSDLARYNDLLHQVILRFQLECLAVYCNHIDIQTLAAYTGALTEAEYVNNIEPTILDDTSVSVEIDSRTKTISFRNSSKSKMLESFELIAKKIDLQPASSPTRSTGHYSDFAATQSQTTEPFSISAADLTAAYSRSSTLHIVQLECSRTKTKRAADMVRIAEERRNESIVQKTDLERKKQEAAKEENVRSLYPEYRERQRQERNKEVLRKLRLKYPGFKISDSIVYLSPSEYEDELTSLLASFKRRAVDTDRKDILYANLHEKTVRSVEIPKRKQLDANNAEKHRAERAAARENFLANHRREYERRMSEKEALQKFLTFADQFEAQWRSLSTVDRLSKRDEQQRLLEEEMRRLADE